MLILHHVAPSIIIQTTFKSYPDQQNFNGVSITNVEIPAYQQNFNVVLVYHGFNLKV